MAHHPVLPPLMDKKEIGFATTVRIARGEDGQFHFARPVTLTERLLAAALPALWALVALVVAVVVIAKLVR